MTMTTRTPTAHPLAAVSLACLGLLAVAAGCAVLTVDIDVYKGPLANHVDVQTEQAAITALAAKPLLSKLRYQLERLARYRALRIIDHDPALKRLEAFPDYIPTYSLEEDAMADPFQDNESLGAPWLRARDQRAYGRGEFAFESPQASFVNRVLAEYDDPDEVEVLHSLQQKENHERPDKPDTRPAADDDDTKKLSQVVSRTFRRYRSRAQAIWTRPR
jgi:hypothetical protein